MWLLLPRNRECTRHQHTPLITQGPKISGTDNRLGDVSKPEQMDVDHPAQGFNQRFRRAATGLGAGGGEGRLRQVLKGRQALPRGSSRQRRFRWSQLEQRWRWG